MQTLRLHPFWTGGGRFLCCVQVGIYLCCAVQKLETVRRGNDNVKLCPRR